MAGDLRIEYGSVPTYRRCDAWEIQLPGADPAVASGLRLRFMRQGAAGWEPVASPAALDPGGFRELSGNVLVARRKLVCPSGAPLPVGLYRAEVWSHRGGADTMLAAPAFAVIFNHEEASQEIDGSWDLEFLSPFLPVVTLEAQGLTVFRWNLDIHHPWVFHLALQAAAGTDDAAVATRRIARLATRYVHGYWPALAALDGGIPQGAPPPSPHPRRGDLSVVTWLANPDQRGQCYDYAVLLVSLLRSVGLPARAVTATNPLPMPHPYDISREVQWAFHVWVEVKGRDGWHAVDLAYQDALARKGVKDFGLQPEMGNVLAAALGPYSRVFLPTNRAIFDMTSFYGVNRGAPRGSQPERVNRRAPPTAAPTARR